MSMIAGLGGCPGRQAWRVRPPDAGIQVREHPPVVIAPGAEDMEGELG